MKKQQKPNWQSALAAVVLVCSMLSFMSTKKNDRIEETSKQLVSDLSSSEYRLTEFDNDTVSLAKAMMEIVSDRSPITTGLDEDGNLAMVYRNGKPIEGEELKVYREAFEKLEMYASTVILKKQQEKLARKQEVNAILEEEVAQMREMKNERVRELATLRLQEEQLRQKNINVLKLQQKTLQEEGLTELQVQEIAVEEEKELFEKKLGNSLQKIEELREELNQQIESDKARMEHLYVPLSHSRDRQVLQFNGVEYEYRERLLRFALEELGKEQGKKLIDLDGELIKLSELNVSDDFLNAIKSLEYLSGEEMDGAYPKRKTKGYTAVIKVIKK